MIAPRRKLITYLAVVGLYGVVFGWWMVFFFRQSDYLLRRMARKGVELAPDQVEALRAASDESMRMFLFEGTFLGLMLRPAWRWCGARCTGRSRSIASRATSSPR